jgi:Leucine Rich repeat
MGARGRARGGGAEIKGPRTQVEGTTSAPSAPLSCASGEGICERVYALALSAGSARCCAMPFRVLPMRYRYHDSAEYGDIRKQRVKMSSSHRKRCVRRSCEVGMRKVAGSGVRFVCRVDREDSHESVLEEGVGRRSRRASGTGAAVAAAATTDVRLRRLARLSEDEVRRGVMGGKDVEGWLGAPRAVCYAEGTNCATFWDCDDLAWVCGKWMKQLEWKEGAWSSYRPEEAEVEAGAEAALARGDVMVLMRRLVLKPARRLAKVVEAMRAGQRRSEKALGVRGLTLGVGMTASEAERVRAALAGGVLAEVSQLTCRNTLFMAPRGPTRSEGDVSTALVCAPLLPHLTTLHVSDNKLTSGEAAELARVLASLPQLTDLDLGLNAVADEGAEALAGALTHVPRLTSLRLSRNGVREAGARALAGALSSVTRLTELDLANNPFGDAGAAHIAHALSSVALLSKLNLSNNAISEAGAAHIAHALSSVSRLTKLSLAGNAIGDAGTAALARALPSVPHLTDLNLARNSVREEGASALTAALASLPCLAVLDVSSNVWGVASTEALRSAASSMPSLTSLYLINLRAVPSGEVLPIESPPVTR